MQSPIERASEVKAGLNYLVPLSWWEQLRQNNIQVSHQNNFIFTTINNEHLIDSFLIDFKDDIQDQYELKCNYLKFKRVLISPQTLPDTKWKAIPPSLWKLFLRSRSGFDEKCPYPILTYLNSSQEQILKNTSIQLSIVFCSRSTSQLFIGFMPETAPLVAIIREVGFEMGFIEMQNSRISFPEKYAQKNYTFSQMEHLTAKNSPDMLLIAFNLQRHSEEEDVPKKIHDYKSLGAIQDTHNQSNQAVAGDLLTMIDGSRQRVNDGTLSTGAQTPFSFFGSQGYDLDRQYRVNELFRDKSPQEVQTMKIIAKEAINGQLIGVPSKKQETMQEELQKMAEQILEGLHIHKKKNKQKQSSNTHQ